MSDQDAINAEQTTPFDALWSTAVLTAKQALQGANANELRNESAGANAPKASPAVIAEAQKYAKENGLDPNEVLRKERAFQQAMQQAGFRQETEDASGFPQALQLQVVLDAKSETKRIQALFERAKRNGKYVTLELERIQLSLKADYSNPKDYIVATSRFDVGRRVLQQLNFELRDPGKIEKTLIGPWTFDGYSVIVNVDSAPKGHKLAGYPGTGGYQYGILLKTSIDHKIALLFELMVVLNLASIVGTSVEGNAKDITWDFTKVLAFVVSANAVLPLSLIPGLSELCAQLGGKWTLGMKVFGRATATKEGWLRAGGLIAEGASAVATFVVALPALSATIAAALVTAVAVGAGVYRDLKTRNYLPMLTAYATGYADGLIFALEKSLPDLIAEMAGYADFPAVQCAAQIRAILRKEDLGELIQAGRGPTSHDILFHEAVRASENLGRAAILGSIATRLNQESDWQGAWLKMQKHYRSTLLPTLRQRHPSWSFRSWLIERLTLGISSRDQDVHDIAVVLEDLGKLITKS